MKQYITFAILISGVLVSSYYTTFFIIYLYFRYATGMDLQDYAFAFLTPTIVYLSIGNVIFDKACDRYGWLQVAKVGNKSEHIHNMEVQFNTKDLLSRFDSSFRKTSLCIESVVLPDGRVCEIQIIATTDTKEFFNEVDNIQAFLK